MYLLPGQTPHNWPTSLSYNQPVATLLVLVGLLNYQYTTPTSTFVLLPRLAAECAVYGDWLLTNQRVVTEHTRTYHQVSTMFVRGSGDGTRIECE